jgi:two-component system, OmpR family, response regulator
LRQQNKKRTQTNTKPKPATPSLQYGKLAIHPEQHTATWNGTVVNLTATEFAMLLLLVRQPNRVFSRDLIMNGAYNNIYISDRTIDSHVRHIANAV